MEAIEDSGDAAPRLWLRLGWLLRRLVAIVTCVSASADDAAESVVAPDPAVGTSAAVRPSLGVSCRSRTLSPLPLPSSSSSTSSDEVVSIGLVNEDDRCNDESGFSSTDKAVVDSTAAAR